MGAYDHELKGYIDHEPCPKCGSQDNVSVYYNDDLDGYTKFCRTPGCDYMITDYDLRRQKGMKDSKPAKSMPIPKFYDFRVKKPHIRGIPYDVWTKYRSGYVPQERILWFSYEVNEASNTCLGAKVRTPDKEFSCKGSVKGTYLFGKHTVNLNRKTIIITEGEIDAMSVNQMTNLNVVSLPSGASSAVKAVKENLKFLEQFEKVWICFDRDEAGMKAADAVMDILKPGTAHLVLLEDGMDANDYLMNGLEKEFRECLNDAKPRVPSNVITGQEVWDAYQEYERKTSLGISTGLKGMDSHFLLRPGEVTTIIGMPSVGKSSLVRQVAANLIKQDKKIMVFSYEENYLEYYKRILCMVFDINPLQMTEADRIFLEANHSYVDEHLVFHKAPTSDMEESLRLIEYGVRGLGVDLVIYDNLTGALGGSHELKEEVGGFYNSLTNLTKEHLFHTIIVSHVRRDKELENGEPPSISHAYGTGHIERLSDNILAIGSQGNMATLAMRKQRHSGRLFEVNVVFNPRTYSYNENTVEYKNTPKLEVTKENDGTKTESGSESDTVRKLRQRDGEGSSQVNSESPPNPIKVPSRDVRNRTDKKVQPRLSDTVQKGNHIYRGQRSTRQKNNRAIESFKARGEEQTYIIRPRQNKKVQQALQEQHRAMGIPEQDSSL